MLLSVLTVEAAVRPSAEEQSEMLLFQGKKRLEGVWKEGWKAAGRKAFLKTHEKWCFFLFLEGSWKEAWKEAWKAVGRKTVAETHWRHFGREARARRKKRRRERRKKHGRPLERRP